MGIGISIFFLAVGAILAFAVEAEVQGINISTVGVILMIVGAIGLAVSLMLMARADRGVTRDRVVERDPYV